MSGFTKLVPEIVQSSIWNETSDIRIVWITMLAIKDENGYVRGDARTIARIANVGQDAADDALLRFQQPDPSSHTPDNEGRRIAPAPGGWIVLNHELYRIRDRNAYFRNYMQQRRAEGKGTDVKDVNVNITKPSVSVSVSASASVSGSGSGSGGVGGGKRGQILAFGELGKVRLSQSEYDKLVEKHGEEAVKAGIELLDGYVGGKRRDPYANHYAVMKDGSWVWERVEKMGIQTVPSSEEPEKPEEPMTDEEKRFVEWQNNRR